MSNGFKINEYDKCIYYKNTKKTYVMLYLYVDEMLNQTKNMLKENFEMKDMVVDVTLGIKVTKKNQTGLS